MALKGDILIMLQSYVLQLGVLAFLEETVAEIVVFLPRLIYVAENIDRWMGRASAGTPTPHNSPQADGGEASKARRSSSARRSDGGEASKARRSSSDLQSDGGEQSPPGGGE